MIYSTQPYVTRLHNARPHKVENYLNMLPKFHQIKSVYLPKPAHRPPGTAATFSSLKWNENVNVPFCTNNKILHLQFSSLQETSAGQLSISTRAQTWSRTTNRLLQTAPGTNCSAASICSAAIWDCSIQSVLRVLFGCTASVYSTSVHGKFIPSAAFIKFQQKKTSGDDKNMLWKVAKLFLDCVI